MRERIRFETELLDLDLGPGPEAPASERAFEVGESPEHELPEPYVIRGGLYDAREKARAAAHPQGLIRTSSVVGKEEKRLAGRAPYTLSVGKEMSRFEAGKMGKWVADYNEFTHYLEEALRAIGRLRDLLSAGAPEAPGDMTSVQKHALRPTDDTKASLEKKGYYHAWRAKQDAYAAAQDGRLVGGLAFEVARTGREFDFARQDFWQAEGKLARSVAEGRRLKKPKFEDIDISLADLAGVVSAGSVPGAVIAGAGVLVDWALEARKHRREYDEKMKRLEELVKSAKDVNADDFEAFKGAGEKYWTQFFLHRRAVWERDQARDAARQAAAMFGQSIAPPSTTAGHVLASIRMPPLIADAWRTLAITGPAARTKLSTVVAARGLMDKATFHFKKSKTDPFGAEDITNVLQSFRRAESWRPLLAPELVGTWVTMNRLWQEVFRKFNV